MFSPKFDDVCADPSVCADPELDAIKALKGLDDEQRAAASAEAKRLVILAAAGSGKTRTTISRLGWRLATGVKAEGLLLTTFTRQAAEEMRQRLTQAVGEVAERVPVGTLHSHCLNWLPTLLPELPPIEVVASEPQDLCAELRREARYESGRFCFDELEEEVALLLDEATPATCAWAAGFTEILVDEAQDLSSRQAELLMRLAEVSGASLTLIGDDYQSIYAFRGAHPKFIVSCTRDPSWRVCTIGTNYRSRAPIVAAAQKLITHNLNRSDKPARAARGEGPEISWRALPDLWTEICTHLTDLTRAGLPYDSAEPSTAVLLRTNGLLSSWEHACWVAGVRFLRLGREELPLDEQPGGEVLLPLLRLIAGVGSAEDTARWRAFCDTQADGAALSIQRAAGAWAGGDQRPEWGLQRLLDSPWLGEGRPSLRQRLIQRAALSVTTGAGDTADSEAAEAVEALEQGLAWLSFTAHGEPWLSAWLLALERWSWRRPLLTLGTIHQSKGREWSRVILPRMEEGILPWRQALGCDDAMEEERRIAYVALTRARDELKVSWTLDNARPSRFIKEARPAVALSQRVTKLLEIRRDKRRREDGGTALSYLNPL